MQTNPAVEQNKNDIMLMVATTTVMTILSCLVCQDVCVIFIPAF